MNRTKHIHDRCALVAGGAGFIGSHLCHKLLSIGYMRVICLDNLSTGSMSNVIDLMDKQKFVFVEKDIIEGFDINEEIDEIYQLACPASPAQYMKDPIHTFKSSIVGSINLLELAKKKNARIMLASTSEVYGDPLKPIQNESYWGNVNPYGVRSCYDEGKRGAETLFHDYHNMYNVDTRIIRIFNTYGPNMSPYDGRVVSNFIVQALQGHPLTVYGNGTQTRSFQYIDDLIEAIMRVMQDDVCNSPINVGNPHEISVIELGRAIIKMTNSQSEICHLPLPLDDPHQRCPDTSLAKKMLNGWTPKTDIEAGLHSTIQYFRNIYKAKNIQLNN